MSQLSSTLKRYVDSSRYAETTYGKVPSGYSSYTSYGSTVATSFADSNKIGFKTSYLGSPRYHHTGLSPTSGYDSSRLPLYPDSNICLSPTYIRTRPPGSGLSGGACYTFAGAPSSPLGYLPTTAPLSRRKSISHSDLAREFSGLHTSDSAYSPTLSPLSTRGRQELGTLQGLYQAATRSDYVRGYLESYGRKSSHGSLPTGPLSPSQASFSSALPPSGTHCTSQPCERNDGYCDMPARDPTVRGACWGWGSKLRCSGICGPCLLALSRGDRGTLHTLPGNLGALLRASVSAFVPCRAAADLSSRPCWHSSPGPELLRQPCAGRQVSSEGLCSSLPALLGAQLPGLPTGALWLRVPMCWQERVRRTFLHACVTAGDGTRGQTHTPMRANLHGCTQ